MNLTHQEHIDAYLRGELNPAQMKEFNALMETDPSFAQQVGFEKKVVEGLSDVRRAELKARLEAIDVAPVGWFNAGQVINGTAAKILGGAVVASVASFILYTNLDSSVGVETPVKEISTEVNFPAEAESVYFHWDIATSDNPEKLETSSIVENRSVTSADTEEKPKISPVDEPVIASEDFDLKVDLPQPEDLAKEEGIEITDADFPEISNTDELLKQEVVPVDVETIDKKNDGLKYKYFDGKLFLYGDFNESPYEILEINGLKERTIYLFFENHYFNIDVTDKVRDLDRIENPKLVRELEIIRNNKR